MATPAAILIAGPTASGKSALALALAQKLGGVILNADAMQVYRDLRIITARPTPEDEARVPHRLYGHVEAGEDYSVGRYLLDAAAALAEARRAGWLPILVGGTGLYFKALTQGTPMIMGRRTFESLPGVLEGRRHIVLTRDRAWQDENAEVAGSVDEAIRLANAPRISVIGGAEIYDQFLTRADRIELTEVHMDADGEVRIDRPDAAGWEETQHEHHPAEGTRPAYSFVTFRRLTEGRGG